jgi:hypothetical protein
MTRVPLKAKLPSDIISCPLGLVNAVIEVTFTVSARAAVEANRMAVAASTSFNFIIVFSLLLLIEKDLMYSYFGFLNT